MSSVHVRAFLFSLILVVPAPAAVYTTRAAFNAAAKPGGVVDFTVAIEGNPIFYTFQGPLNSKTRNDFFWPWGELPPPGLPSRYSIPLWLAVSSSGTGRLVWTRGTAFGLSSNGSVGAAFVGDATSIHVDAKAVGFDLHTTGPATITVINLLGKAAIYNVAASGFFGVDGGISRVTISGPGLETVDNVAVRLHRF